MNNKQYHHFFSPVFVEDKSFCTGCGACANICKHHAISMESNDEGFLYPRVNRSLCVECGLCDTKCPVNNNQQENTDYSPACYLAKTKIEWFYKKSATIGICTMLAKYVIESHGVVYGAYLDEDEWEVRHIKVDNVEGLELIRNSKYAQSQTYNTFAEVLSLLKRGVKVLYIGTPCQIAGLKACLHHSYDNLFTIDLICHGVYSHKILKKEIEFWEQKYGKISNFKFRSKEVFDWLCGGIINFDYEKLNGEKGHVERPGCSSPTYYCYAYSKDRLNHNLRLSCYNCKFRSSKRYADITVGDSWCINLGNFRRNRFFDYKNGTSLVQINTEKGKQMLQWTQDYLTVQEISQELAYVQPALKKINRPKPITRETIYASLETGENYGKVIETLFSISLEDEYKRFVNNYKREKTIKTLKNLIKKIIP